MSDKPLVGIQLHDHQNDPHESEIAGLIRDLKIQITLGPVNWGVVEPKIGKRDWKTVEHWEHLEKVAGQMPQFVWTLYPVHMNARGSIPKELKTVPFEDPRMLETFEGFVRDISERAGWGEGSIVKIGNEVDLFQGEHAEEVPGFIQFANEAADLIRKYAPGSKVCNALTWDSVKRDNGALCDALNENTDIVAFNWYDLGEGLHVGSSNLDEEMSGMEKYAKGKPVLIGEIGLPSGKHIGSSEQMQASRVEELFDCLSKRTRHQIHAAIWLSLNDWPRKTMEKFVKHQFPTLAGNEPFLDFLITLGLRKEDGTPKPAYEAWVRKAAEY